MKFIVALLVAFIAVISAAPAPAPAPVPAPGPKPYYVAGVPSVYGGYYDAPYSYSNYYSYPSVYSPYYSGAGYAYNYPGYAYV